MAHDLERLQNAGFFAEQTPYGPDVHTRKLAVYFDEHYAESYLKLSADAVMTWLDTVIADLKVASRAGKHVTTERVNQYLKDFGAGLPRTWLAIMAEETPKFLRRLVNRTEFQARHEAHLQNITGIRIDFLTQPAVAPSPAAPSAPDRVPVSGLAYAVAAELTPVPISEPGADITLEVASASTEPAPGGDGPTASEARAREERERPPCAEPASADNAATHRAAGDTAPDVKRNVDRRAKVDQFIEEVLREKGRRIKRADIWRVAGYTEATEFERFQRNQGTEGSEKRFNRTLSLEPKQFLERLDKLGAKKARAEENHRVKE